VSVEELKEIAFEDEGSVFVLDGETSCCGDEVVEEGARRRLVPFFATPAKVSGDQ